MVILAQPINVSSKVRQDFLEKKMKYFFKVILPRTLRDRKLEIPSDFVQIHGKTISNYAVLKVGNGVWKVEVKKTDGKMWFKNGMKGFFEYHSICCGFFLIFKYKGNSEFHVRILDRSAVEPEFHIDFGSFEEENNGDEGYEQVPNHTEEEEKDSVEILGVSRRISPAHEIDSDDGYEWNPQHLTRSPLRFDSGKRSRSVNSKDKGPATQRGPNVPVRGRCLDLTYATRVVKKIANQKHEKACQEAISFKPKNPHFKVIMQPTYVEGKFALNIPFSFMRRYVGVGIHDMILITCGGEWTVECHMYASSVCKLYSWRAFSKENYLRVGDVCVFEVIEATDLRFQVSIFYN